MAICKWFGTTKGCCLLMAVILSLTYVLLLSETLKFYDTGMFSLIFSVMGISLLVMWVSIFACKN